MSAEGEGFCPRLGVPHLHGLVVTSRDNAAAVRAECHAVDTIRMPDEGVRDPSRSGRPRLLLCCQNFPRQCGDRPG